MTTILNIIKEKYPRAVFNPIKLSEKGAIGFVLTPGHLIVGIISDNGSLCKLTDPIDLKLLDKDSFYKLMTKLPIGKNLEGNLHNLLEGRQEINLKIDELQKDLEETLDITEKYKILYDTQSEEYLGVKDRYEQQIEKITQELLKAQTCINDIENQKETITTKLQEYNSQINDYIKNHKLSDKETLKVFKKISKEIELMFEKINKIKKIGNSKTILENELENLKKEYSEEKFKNDFYKKCGNKILEEKDTLIEKIKEYNQQWNEWADENKYSIIEQKNKIKQEIIKINEMIKNVLNFNYDKKIKSAIKAVENELKKSSVNQLAELIKKEKEIEELQQQILNLNETNEQKVYEIEQLKIELGKIKALLKENESTKIDASGSYDYDNCYLIVQNLIDLNNMFYRKIEILKIIDNILSKNLIESNYIKDDYIKVKTEILKLIDFMDLEKYIKSSNIPLFKSKTTMNKIPVDFCEEVINVLEYWNVNKGVFLEHDRLLTNIYEDLSGAVRVYVRIKPLIGTQNNSEKINLVVDKENKSIKIECNNKTGAYNNFYDVFDDSYTNADIFTGETSIKGDTVIFDPTQINNGLYNVFKQLEDGYSVVVMGYGGSGSGKSHSLLGTFNTPGLVQYGLLNLEGVANIKIRHLFEQYHGLMNLNFNKMTGKIYNLVGEVPQMRAFSKDVREDFNYYNTLDLNNIKSQDLSSLFSQIDEYRIQNKRIKETPNNPVSSRSHLYIIFEIQFTNGKLGYLTVVDMAGKESPENIFNQFVDTSKTTLESAMSAIGRDSIAQYMRPEYRDKYTGADVLSLLNEGFYINEILNHLVYFLNKKMNKKTKVLAQSTLSNYSKNKFYVSPITEETQIKSENNSLMIPIMKFLDNFNKKENKFKPTKYIMLCNIRQELKYCDEIFDTLEFVNNIKSS